MGNGLRVVNSANSGFNSLTGFGVDPLSYHCAEVNAFNISSLTNSATSRLTCPRKLVQQCLRIAVSKDALPNLVVIMPKDGFTLLTYIKHRL